MVPRAGCLSHLVNRAAIERTAGDTSIEAGCGSIRSLNSIEISATNNLRRTHAGTIPRVRQPVAYYRRQCLLAGVKTTGRTPVTELCGPRTCTSAVSTVPTNRIGDRSCIAWPSGSVSMRPRTPRSDGRALHSSTGMEHRLRVLEGGMALGESRCARRGHRRQRHRILGSAPNAVT